MKGYDDEVKSLDKQQSLITSIIGLRKIEQTVINDDSGGGGGHKDKLLKLKKFKPADLIAPYDAEQLKILTETQDRLSKISEIANKIAADQKKERVKDFFNVGQIQPNKTGALADYDKQQAQKEYDRINNQKYLVQLQQDFNLKLAEQQKLADGIGNSFANLFHNIARSKNPFEALQNAVKQLVIDLAAAVAKMLIIKAIMTLINPAGAAAKGIGSIMGAALAGVPQHAAGGITTGPSLGIVGEAGPEAIIPLDRLSGFIDRAAKMGAMSMGGQGQSSGGGEFTLRGQDLVLAMQRSNYSLNLRR